MDPSFNDDNKSDNMQHAVEIIKGDFSMTYVFLELLLTFLWCLEPHGGLVCLNLAEEISLCHGVSFLLLPTDDCPQLHGGRQCRQVNLHVLRVIVVWVKPHNLKIWSILSCTIYFQMRKTDKEF